MAIPYYIKALITGDDELRWNRDEPRGSPVEVSYSFLASVPRYANADIVGPSVGDATPETFRPLTGAQRAAVLDILGLYSEVAGLAFVDNGDDAVARLHFGRTVMAEDTLAYAYLPYPDWRQSGDVWLARGVPGNNEVQPGELGFATLVHEIGHALGLKHPFSTFSGGSSTVLTGIENTEQYTVMAYRLHRHSDFYTPVGELLQIEASGPMLYDIAAIQHLYGANHATRAGDDVYGFSPSDPFLMCIWDGGGVDTVSVARFARGCRVDLREGYFSDITILSAPGFGGTYDGTDNLSIAYGALIENATGGAGDDWLRGNGERNLLRGNGGDDILAGGGGVDRLAGGAGADVFVLGSPEARWDRVSDFQPGVDHVRIEVARFPGLEALTPNQMFAQQRLVYDQPTGSLYYDADGDGSGQVLIARLAGAPAFGAGDVIAG